MTTVALIIQPVAFLAALWVVLRHNHGRDEILERVTRDAELTSRLLVATVEHERDARRDDIQMLLQRIQAPEQAIIQHAVGHAGPVEDVMPRSESESAQATDQAVMARAVLDEIERMEHDANMLPGLVSE